MTRTSTGLALAALVLLASVCPAANPTLGTVMGIVEKADKSSVTLLPKRSDGKFGTALVLKVTGTTKIHALAVQTRNKKPVIVQREIEAQDLKKNQRLAVIYIAGKDSHVLLSAVALAAPGK